MTRNVALCVCLALAVGTGCKRDRPREDVREQASGAPFQPDPALREAVWGELSRSRAIPMDRLVVRVTDGKVTLDGTVNTLAQRAWAEELASRAFGVRSLDNDLKVVATTRPDAELQAAVVAALEADPHTRGRGLEVLARDGAVTLRGKVAQGAERFGAATVVQRVRGVTALANEIQVEPAARGDEEIRADVQHALSWDRGLEGAPVVARVSGGHVHLEGTVENVFAGNLAATAAWVPGVRSVDTSRLQVAPPAAPATATPVTPPATPPVAVADPTIAEAVVRSFGQDPELATGQVLPEVAGGVVTLRGEVTSAAAARAAEDRALRIRGVSSVDNQLVVAPATVVPDAQIAAEAQGVLAGDPDLGGIPISVEVVDGVATLQGSVESTYLELLARHIILSRPGVVAVNSQLQVPAAAPAPATGVVQPSTGVVQPATGVVQPSTTGVQPSTTGVQPSTTGVQPSTTGAP